MVSGDRAHREDTADVPQCLDLAGIDGDENGVVALADAAQFDATERTDGGHDGVLLLLEQGEIGTLLIGREGEAVALSVGADRHDQRRVFELYGKLDGAADRLRSGGGGQDGLDRSTGNGRTGN